MDSMFVFQMRELNSVLAGHQEQTRRFVEETVEASRTVLLENQELRHQVATLKLAVDPKKFSQLGADYQALLGKQIGHANRILVKRDREAREAANENAKLRETLAAMSGSPKAVMSGSPMAMMSGSPTAMMSGDQMALVAASPAGSAPPPLPPGMMLDGPLPPARPASGQPIAAPQLTFNASNPDIVSDMKLRNQPFDDRVIKVVGEETSSDDDDIEDLRPFERKPMKGTVKVMDLTARMRAMMTAAKYDVTDCYHTDGRFQAVARHSFFENITMVVIVMNAVWIGIDAVYNSEALLSDSEPAFIAAENFFCLYFLVELTIRFGAFRNKADAFRDLWFDFDFALVLLMVAETWIIFTILSASTSQIEWAGSPALHLLKLVRLSRVARMTKLMRLMPEVMVLMKGIGVASRSVFFTLCLLWMMIYCFAVAFTQLLEGTSSGEAYFQDLGTAMYTLFFKICFGDALGDVALSLFQEHAIYGLLLLCFVTFAPLTVLNMLTGILVEVVRVVSSFEQEAMDTLYVSEQIQMVFEELDTNNNGKVTLEGFDQLMEQEKAVAALTNVGIDTFTLTDDPERVFQGETSISFGDFVQELMQIRSANPATIKDVQTLRKHVAEDLAWFFERQHEMQARIQNKKDTKKTKRQMSRRSQSM